MDEKEELKVKIQELEKKVAELSGKLDAKAKKKEERQDDRGKQILNG